MNDDRRRLDDILVASPISVDLDVLWDTVVHDLPELAVRIRTHLDLPPGF